MTYYLHIGYYSHTDDFFALVDDGAKYATPIFTIDTIEEICEYIKTGRMKHIDDVKGLESFMMEMEFITNMDTLEIGELFT